MMVSTSRRRRVFGVSNYAPWWGSRLPPDILTRVDAPGIAGGETMMLEQCFALAAGGNDVTLFSDTFAEGVHAGVIFRPRAEYDRAVVYDGVEPDVVLSWQTPYGLHHAPETSARILVQQCNDLNYPVGWTNYVDALVAASANHGQFLRALGYQSALEVVHNGCHIDRYPKEPLAPQKREPIVAYWSSPDRGLHHLLNAWPFVRKARPDAILRVHYEIEKIFKHMSGEGMSDRMRMASPQALMRVELLRDAVLAAKKMPGVVFTGMLSRARLIAAQCETRVLCYPASTIAYTEGFSGATAEALAAGCLPLIRAIDALPSLYDGAVRWIEGDPIMPEFPRQLADQILSGLEWTGESDPSLAAIRARAERWTWRNSGRETLRMVERVLARKAGISVPDAAFPLEDSRWKGAA